MRWWVKWVVIPSLAVIVGTTIYVIITDAGSIEVAYADCPHEDHQTLRQQLEEWGAFNATAAALDEWLRLPADVRVWFADCGEANAFYHGATREVVMCYELVTDLAQRYAPHARTHDVLTTAVWQTVFFVFYHEIGHALIDVLDLPATGREEDSVDQLATWVLLNAGEQGRDAALQGAAWFWIVSGGRGIRTPFWDEHALDEQRYFNILCWVYGSNPEAHQALLGRDWQLPRQRADHCPREYARLAGAWSSLLAPHTY